MDVSIMVRRKKSNIFLDAKEDTTVCEIKQMLECITKVPVINQQLYKGGEVMENSNVLGDYGLNAATAKPQNPPELGLAFRESENSEFEPLDITPYSNPPELPDVMKPIDPQQPAADQAMA